MKEKYMPMKYYEIKDILRKELSFFDGSVFLVKILLLYVFLILYWFLVVRFSWLFLFRTGPLILILLVIYRFTILFERLSIKNLAIFAKQERILNQKQTRILISDIDFSLNKVNSLAIWSCGVLVTLFIFFATFFLNFSKDWVILHNISKVYSNEFPSEALVDVLRLTIAVIICLLLFSYLVFYLFFYERIIVSRVLKTSIYISAEDKRVESFKDKLTLAVKHFI